MIHMMYHFVRRNAPFNEVWGISCPPIEGGTAATGSIKIRKVPTVSGIINFTIGGVPIECRAVKGEAINDIALRMVTVINRNQYCPVVAALNGTDPTTIDCTCRWIGVSGNKLRFLWNYYGSNRYPGTMAAFTQFTGGSGSPNLSTTLAMLGDELFDVRHRL
jgi:phage tail sheath gpL-like